MNSWFVILFSVTGNSGKIPGLRAEERMTTLSDVDMLILRYLWEFQVSKAGR